MWTGSERGDGRIVGIWLLRLRGGTIGVCCPGDANIGVGEVVLGAEIEGNTGKTIAGN